MSDMKLGEVGFADSNELELLRYRAVSRSALASLFLGLLSFVTLVHWMLAVVPLAAAATGILALRAISRSESQLVGRKLALTGMLLGLFFVAWAFAENAVKNHVLNQQAKAYATYWLDLVSGAKIEPADTAEQRRDKNWRLYEAFELHRHANERLPAGLDFGTVYGDLETKDEPNVSPDLDPLLESKRSFRMFFSSEPIKTILAAGGDGQFQFEGIQHETRGKSLNLLTRFAFTFTESGKRKTIHIIVRLERAAVEEEVHHWSIVSVDYAGST